MEVDDLPQPVRSEKESSNGEKAPPPPTPKGMRFLVGMEVRVSDGVKDGTKAGQEGVLFEVSRETCLLRLEDGRTIGVHLTDLEPFIPDIDEPCKLLVHGETEQVVRMKEYIENDEDNVLIQLPPGSVSGSGSSSENTVRKIPLDQLCKVSTSSLPSVAAS